MKLPNGHRAIIDERKLTEYGLNFDHEDGKHKAVLFRDLAGIAVENHQVLVTALRSAARKADAQPGRSDRYGRRYVVDFDMSGPTRRVTVRSVWLVPAGETVPRPVTRYIL